LAGVRLHDFLARSWPEARREELRQLVAAGEVSLNGEVCVSDRRLRDGDVVLVAGRPSTRPTPARDAANEIAVLAETATALVVDKPAGVPSVPSRNGRESGVHGRLLELRPDDDLRIVHRLDRNTSGCLVLARGLEAARHFDLQFRERRVHKTYVALVGGVPHLDEFAIDAWLGPDRRRPGMVVASDRDKKGFREAHTAVTVRQRFRRHALVELRPTTGRGHQLRVHLQSIGHPIVGDEGYGGERLLLSRLKPDYKKRKGVDERPLLQRMFLHAERVSFVDVDGDTVDVEATLPEDLAVALRQVEKHANSTRRPQCD
ncbi:MAG: RluA family pseudouridine synthase, partial [Planctomycetes bacterium]|nr:RluA family pseudouridine synthase [Planctomycetota bacterium]